MIVLLAAAAAMALTIYAAHDTWFRIDAWEFLMRSQEGSLDSWIRPHGAHLQLPAVALHRFLYATFGMDFWPWYFLPHVLGYAGLIVYMWRVLLARGTCRVVALSTCVVLLFLGAAAFLSSVVMGSLMVMALLLVVASRLDGEGRPSPAQQLTVAGALLVMAVTSSLGLAALIGCLAAVVVSRRLRWWWWCFLPAVLAYGGWYLAYGGKHAQSAIDWDLVLLSGIVLITGGAASPFIILYFLIIIGAGILFYRAGSMIAAAASAVLFGIAVAAPLVPRVAAFIDPEGTTLAMGRAAVGYRHLLAVFSFFLVAFLASHLAESLRRVGEELSQASASLADLERRSEHILQSIASGLVTTDLDGRITYCNRAAERIAQVQAAAVVGPGSPSTRSSSCPPGLTRGGTRRRSRARRCGSRA